MKALQILIILIFLISCNNADNKKGVNSSPIIEKKELPTKITTRSRRFISATLAQICNLCPQSNFFNNPKIKVKFYTLLFIFVRKKYIDKIQSSDN